jgi:hypothetical protein
MNAELDVRIRLDDLEKRMQQTAWDPKDNADAFGF